MEDNFEEMVSDFEVGDEVIITMDVSPFTYVGLIDGYSEFLPGLMVNVVGALDSEKVLSKNEESEIKYSVLEMEIDDLVNYSDDPPKWNAMLALTRQIASRLDVPDIDDVFRITNEYRGLVEEAASNLIDVQNEEYRRGNSFSKYAAPIKTYIPFGCIVRMELLKDSLHELDLMEFDESLEDALKQMTKESDAD